MALLRDSSWSFLRRGKNVKIRTAFLIFNNRRKLCSLLKLLLRACSFRSRNVTQRHSAHPQREINWTQRNFETRYPEHAAFTRSSIASPLAVYFYESVYRASVSSWRGPPPLERIEREVDTNFDLEYQFYWPNGLSGTKAGEWERAE